MYGHICMNHDLSSSKGIRFMKNRSLSRLVKADCISSTFYAPKASSRRSSCVCTQTLGCFRDRLLFIRVGMEVFTRCSNVRSFRVLNVSQGNDAEVFFFFLEFARYSNLGSKLLFFMFEELLCNSVTWKIRGKSSR